MWLVLCAFFLSRGVLKTGLGRRIAFLFIRALGRSSLGLAYALVSTDTLLAAFLPSNSARAGGVVFPVARSLAEAYDSQPGPTARRLGAYLLFTIYQCDVVACADLSHRTGVERARREIRERHRRHRPHVFEVADRRVGARADFARVHSVAALQDLSAGHHAHAATRRSSRRKSSTRIGPMRREERIMLAVFALVAGLWMTTALHHINYAVVALLGISVLFLSGVLSWDEIIGEKPAWDVFIWYGGLLGMAEALSQSGVTSRFAQGSAAMTAGWSWGAALAVLLLIYFYAHYGFASITAHATAMFTPFLLVVVAAGAPPLMAVLFLAYFSNLSASLTHYGTTTAPIYFGANYITQRDWWRLGLLRVVCDHRDLDSNRSRMVETPGLVVGYKREVNAEVVSCVLYGMKRLFFAVAVIVAAFGVPALARAQVGSTTDIITGKVTGPNGEPIAGARVEVMSLETQVTRFRTTNEKGQYTLLYPDGGGQYRVTFKAIGMAPFTMNLNRQADEDRLEADAKM